MNLSQPITLDQFKQLGKLLKSSRSILISVLSVLLITFFAFNCYAIYGNYESFEQKNADFLDLSNQMRLNEKKLSKLVNGEAKYFAQLNVAPANKSELVDLLSNLASSNNLIVKKLLANDVGQNKGQDGLVEMELDGRYPSIQEFLNKIKPVLAASNVELVKLEKRKENQYIHMTMKVKFSQPPELKKVKSSVAFNYKGADYLYDTFESWRMRSTGFVQVPNSPGAQQQVIIPKNSETTSESSDVIDAQKRADPFLPSPKTSQLDSSAGTRRSGDLEGSMFLSGILYAKHKAVCIVTMASGESKVFEVGDNLDGKKRVTAIKSDAIVIRSVLDREYKVGQEIHVK